MAHKELKYEAEARKALEAGVDAVANAVKVTLGPKGRYVVLDKKFGAPTITNDGVTIAREVEVADIFQNQGAQLIREVATATNDVAGDGTTTATVLAQAIVRGGLLSVTAGANPVALKRGIEKAVDAVVEHIASQAEPVHTGRGHRAGALTQLNVREVEEQAREILTSLKREVGESSLGATDAVREASENLAAEAVRSAVKAAFGLDQVARVATISAGDDEIGDVIADAIEKVGKDRGGQRRGGSDVWHGPRVHRGHAVR